jgi:hypothetical protein
VRGMGPLAFQFSEPSCTSIASDKPFVRLVCRFRVWWGSDTVCHLRKQARLTKVER